MTKVFDFNKNIEPETELKDSVFILGSFEAIHKGHQQLIDIAKQNGDAVTLMMISNPQVLPKSKDKAFMDLKSRIQMAANLKVDNILLIEFNEYTKNLEGERFLEILKQLGAKYFVAGSDFKLGKGGKTTAQDIKNLYKDSIIADFVTQNSSKISTSLLKENLFISNFKYINEVLVQPYLMNVKIDFRKQIYFSEDLMDLVPGIYYCKFIYNNKKYLCYLHISYKDQKVKIYFLNLDIEIEDIIEGYIEILDTKRIIVSEQNDKVFDNEAQEIEDFFVSL
ncbi:FAD synthase [Mycoplasma procyoni]|uniref:FAD synthase n=1 Tax=Mycoplasma procyoni TaxID=568784 RepID=UPI00197C4D1F|nr:adenylyltransferase/cytidyltransferase family protein [Mycoplasma procyoni]MBN3535133.1 adenylyltransferase/cytidyltransferase family protein [Mycoplasma procyoni]